MKHLYTYDRKSTEKKYIKSLTVIYVILITPNMIETEFYIIYFMLLIFIYFIMNFYFNN